MSNCMIDIANCLKVDPFEGDFGSGDEHTFRDKLVVARKEHECMICGSVIPEGMLHRTLAEKSGGVVATSRYCFSCCVAQAVACQFDDTNLLDSRYEIR